MNVLSRLLDRPVEGPSIERMRHRHIGQVLAIEQVSYPKPWTAKVFHDELDQVRAGRRHYVVARAGRRVVGYAGLMFVDTEAHVTNVAVHPDHRRHRVATALLVHLARRAIDRGCEAWTLEVRTSSVGAQALYREFGFVPAGVRKAYYEGREDAIVMWCEDIGSVEYSQRLGRLS
ncbi:MAG: ribosomal protein S18-alanine N-acetyltransferase [Desertimonas sp.]